MELLPVIGDRSVLAIVFPYRMVGFEPNLLANLTAGATVTAVRELWADEDDLRIPLVAPTDGALKAVPVEFDGGFYGVAGRST